MGGIRRFIFRIRRAGGPGTGAFLGAGFNAQVSPAEAPTTGFDSQSYLEGDTSLAGGFGGNITGNSNGGADISGAKGFPPGLAIGSGAFVGKTYTATAVSPTIGSICHVKSP